MAQTKKAVSDATAKKTTHGLREVGLLGHLALSLYLGLSLLTFDAQDPGWRYTGIDRSPANLGGRVGAWIADLALSWLGAMAWFFPLVLAWHGLQAYRLYRLSSGDLNWIELGRRGLGYIVVTVAGAGFFLPPPLLAAVGVAGDQRRNFRRPNRRVVAERARHSGGHFEFAFGPSCGRHFKHGAVLVATF
nr:cell division FtsK/SpoIIIE [uncultured Gammaproteobacteria bacterium]